MNIHDMNEAIRIAKSDADLDHLSISAFDGLVQLFMSSLAL